MSPREPRRSSEGEEEGKGEGEGGKGEVQHCQRRARAVREDAMDGFFKPGSLGVGPDRGSRSPALSGSRAA